MKREFNETLKKVQFLMERMDKHYTRSESDKLLKESLEELDARDREDVDTTKFFDMISSMKGGIKSTIGYVSAAKLNIPQVKRKNPETGRMKNFDDWETFGKNLNVTEKITGVIKFASYNLNWRSPQAMNKHYNTNYVDPVNAIRSKYGISPIERREGYTQTLNFGNGISAYNGANSELQGHSYSPQDTGGKDCQSTTYYFLIGENGKILKQIDASELKPYFKASTISGKAELVKLNKSEEEIEAYAKEIASINFQYMQFEHSSVVYVITSVNGEKKRYFNKNLTNNIKGVEVDPQEFINLAKKMYQVDITNSDSETFGEVGE